MNLSNENDKVALHFMGIGGVSMHALALWYREEGFAVSGCDAVEGPTLDDLRAAGLNVSCGHDPGHVASAGVVIHSMAVPSDHPELAAARAAGLATLKRIELLGELFGRRRTLAVTGTHGKSTTTGMAATMLLALDTGTSVQLGANLPLIGGSVRYGRGDWLVAEVDESDPGFADLNAEVAVVTNLEDDHVAGEYDERRNYHATLGDLRAAARRFTRSAKRLIYCADWPGLTALLADHPRPVSYGLGADARYRIEGLELANGGSQFSLSRPGREPLVVRLAVPGKHNALNAAAAIAAVEAAGFDAGEAISALAGYTGVGRRWQIWGEVNGALVIDDYAHHPTEVRTMLEIARGTGRRVRAVLQPHRWIRTAQHWRALAQAAAVADEVLVLDIYGAGEKPIAGVSPELIVNRILELGVSAARHDLTSADGYLRGSLAANDLVITLGAGDVWRVASALTGGNGQPRATATVAVKAAGGSTTNANAAHGADEAAPKAHATANPNAERRVTPKQVRLADYTTIKVGGPAELWEVENEADLREATAEPYLVIGAGSNLLVADAGVSRRVIKLGRSFNDIGRLGDGAVSGFGEEVTREGIWLGAATPLPGLVRRAQRAGLAGLEGLLGVPAVLGGAVAMNAGTRFGELAETLQEVELFVDGALVRLPAAALKLAYRHCTLPDGAIVTRARLRLKQSDPATVQAKLDLVDAARKGQPKVKSAGCAFKNPPGDSAGRLIDAAGLKGLRVGDAMVSHEHGNFIVNLGAATAAQVAELLELVRAGVGEVVGGRPGSQLELEWRRWGW